MGLWVRASALAFDTLLALIPLIGLTYWLLGKLGITERWLEYLKVYLMTQLAAFSDQKIQEVLESLLGRVHHFSWGYVGGLLFLYAGGSLITKFGAGLDHILRVRDADQISFDSRYLRLTLRRGIVMAGLPIVLLFSLVVSSWLRENSWLSFLFEIRTVGPLFALPLAWAATLMALWLVYYFVPRNSVQAGSAFRAALLAAALLELTKFLLAKFNSYALTTQQIYGVFASLPVTLLWIQLSWTILMSSGLLLKVRPRQR